MPARPRMGTRMSEVRPQPSLRMGVEDHFRQNRDFRGSARGPVERDNEKLLTSQQVARAVLQMFPFSLGLLEGTRKRRISEESVLCPVSASALGQLLALFREEEIHAWVKSTGARANPCR